MFGLALGKIWHRIVMHSLPGSRPYFVLIGKQALTFGEGGGRRWWNPLKNALTCTVLYIITYKCLKHHSPIICCSQFVHSASFTISNFKTLLRNGTSNWGGASLSGLAQLHRAHRIGELLSWPFGPFESVWQAARLPQVPKQLVHISIETLDRISGEARCQNKASAPGSEKARSKGWRWRWTPMPIASSHQVENLSNEEESIEK